MNKSDVHKVFTGKLRNISEQRGTKEINYTIRIEGKYMCRVTVPKGRGELPIGTLNSIKNQTLLSREDFDRLIKCPMKIDEYKKKLTEKNSEDE